MSITQPKIQNVLKILSSSKVALSTEEVTAQHVRIYPPSDPQSSPDLIAQLKPIFEQKLRVCHGAGLVSSQFIEHGEKGMLEEVFQITAAGIQFLSPRH